MRKPKQEYHVIQTRVPKALAEQIDAYLTMRNMSYNGLVNQLLHEKFYGVNEQAIIKQVMNTKPPKTPVPRKPDVNATGEELYNYWHHPDLPAKDDEAFKWWINDTENAAVFDRYYAHRELLGNAPDYTIPVQPPITQPVQRSTPPDTDIDLDDIIFDED